MAIFTGRFYSQRPRRDTGLSSSIGHARATIDRPARNIVNFARIVTFLLLVSACVAAQTTRRLVYLCDNTAQLPRKTPFAIPDPFKPEPVGGHINLSQINPPRE